MTNFNFKTKILLLTLIPLIIVSVLIIALAAYQTKSLAHKNIDSFSDKIFELRRSELKNYTDIAVSAVKHLTTPENADNSIVQEEVKQVMRNMAFGEDGYFFTYSGHTAIAHPKLPELEGKNLQQLTDPNGVRLIEELYEAAKQGGGITNYIWEKPSRKAEVAKYGYSEMLDGWDWWIGTGLYVDDLEDTVANLRSSVDKNISTALQLIISLALGTVVLVSLIGARLTLSEGKLADEKLQQLSKKSVESQESERSRVARQLQSSVIKTLNFTNANLGEIAKSESFDNSKSREKFIFATKALHKAMQEVRDISGELRPEILDTMGLDAATRALVKEQNKRHQNLDVSYKSNDLTERMSPDVEIVLYRIVQSALTNINEHSEATNATIRISIQRSKVLLSIQDNGIGFDVREANKKGNQFGVGLLDMRVRAESMGGTFSVFSTPKMGTHIKIEIPR